MHKLLLRVENVYEMKGRGVVVTPVLPRDGLMPPPQRPFDASVMLKRPDGTEVSAEASFLLPFFDPQDPTLQPEYVCLLKQVSRSETPVGTEVWLQDDQTVA